MTEQLMRYEMGQAQFRLEVLEEIQKLSLHGHIQRAYRLIGDDHLRPHGECPGYGDTPALPATVARMLGRDAL